MELFDGSHGVPHVIYPCSQVIYSYLPFHRNKPVVLPEKTGEDIEFLKRKFLECFNYTHNVRIAVTFQRFDAEWEEYIDLEDDTDKDVVVSPLLTDTSRCSTEDTEDTNEVRCGILLWYSVTYQ